MNIATRILAAATLVTIGAFVPAHADSYLPQIGGKGGAQYSERRPQGQVLNGFEVRAGDDIDTIRTVCVTPFSPTVASAPPLTNGFGGWLKWGRWRQLETPLQRATRDAKVRRDSNAAIRSATSRAAVKAKPAMAIKSANVRVSKPAAASANRKAIIIVGGKQKDKAKQPTIREHAKDYQGQHHD